MRNMNITTELELFIYEANDMQYDEVISQLELEQRIASWIS